MKKFEKYIFYFIGLSISILGFADLFIHPKNLFVDIWLLIVGAATFLITTKMETDEK